MCQFWDLQCKTNEAVAGAVGSVVDGLAGAISEAQSGLITATVTWWLYLPPIDANDAPAAHTLRQWMLPFAVVVVTGGILWQSLLLIINRKGEPLLTIANPEEEKPYPVGSDPMETLNVRGMNFVLRPLAESNERVPGEGHVVVFVDGNEVAKIDSGAQTLQGAPTGT